MECLDAKVVQDLKAGALDAEAKAAATAHLEGCASCRDRIDPVDTLGQTVAPTPGPSLDETLEPALAPLARTEPRDPSIAMMETLGSQTGALLATALPDDSLVATAPPGDVTRPAAIRAPDQVGRTLGRYTLVERLGAGAMGVVYRALDRELDRDVALKQLHRPDEELTDRLVREARAMAQVNHPNVVAVYDVGATDGTTYIAMELVSGVSLRTWQLGGHTVPEIVAAYVAAGRGLAAAHAAGIVHRDFKPDNVLVGNDGRSRVTDFGLAAARPAVSEARSSSIVDVNLTTSGSVLGTPAYMAPEQFLGAHVDARTDQFNFCVALYEALHGERPFAGKTFPELCDNVCQGRLRSAPAGSNISGALRAIIVRGLAIKPGDRYPTMAHLLAELGKDRARPWRRTSRAAAVLAAMLALGVVSDLVIRDRLEGEIAQSFAATARQTDRAVRLLASRFDAISNQVYALPVMRDVIGHHDEADFGLGTAEDDAADLAYIHDNLVSADWKFAREVAGKQHPAVLAVSDHKGRLLYTSAAPTVWRTDLTRLPWIKAAFDAGTGSSMSLMRYDHPELVASQVLGASAPKGVAVLFTRTLAVGDTPRSQFLQIIGARQLLDDIRLDDETRLALVAADGTSDGDVPAMLAGYRTEKIELRDPLVERGAPIGSLVMARRIDSVLALFPHARSVFALAMLAAVALAIATALRARQITGTRV